MNFSEFLLFWWITVSRCQSDIQNSKIWSFCKIFMKFDWFHKILWISITYMCTQYTEWSMSINFAKFDHFPRFSWISIDSSRMAELVCRTVRTQLFENLGFLLAPRLLARSRIKFTRKNVIFVKFRETVEPRNGATLRVLQRERNSNILSFWNMCMNFYDFYFDTLYSIK